jgi:D-arabinose 1-dehydrogenase-like Zn-dependent alcohol dehydrogenase
LLRHDDQKQHEVRMHSYRLESFGTPLVERHGETPTPRGHEVVMRVGSCGVCHSDVHLADGYFDLGNGNKIGLAASVAPPRTLGHEIAGTVVAIGEEVAGVAIGDRRVVYPWIGCGKCAMCLAGDEHLCNAPRAIGVNVDGGFADHVLVPHERYLFDFAPLSEEQACTYACSGLTAFSALKKVVDRFARSASDQMLLIIGAGGVGLSGIRMAAKLGLPAPIVAEVDHSKWDIAREAGAADVIDPKADGAARALVKATGGGVTAAIDFVGAGETFAFGFGALRKGGTLVAVGLFGGATSISPAMVAIKAARIVGSYVGSPAEMRELMEMARTASLPELPLATLPLDAASETLEALKAGRVKGRAVLKP